MTTRADYTTVQDVRSSYLAAQETTDDALISRLITTTSREIDALSQRHFAPIIETRQFNVPLTGPLVLDDDLLESNILLNGDGTVITSTQYQLYPLNYDSKDRVALKTSSNVQWLPDAAGDYDAAIDLTGVWGFSSDYDHAWGNTGYTLSGSASNSTTTLPATGQLYAGQLLKVDTEYLYVTVSGSASATVERGVNGSTSGSHAQGAAIYAWDFVEVGELCRQAVAGYYRLRANPLGETISIDGVTFQTPKDVRAFMDKQLRMLGLKRIYRL